MKRNNGNGVLVGIFIGIIVMILVFIGLFMTNTISFSSKSDNNSNTSSGDDNLNSGNDITNEDSNNLSNVYLDFINNKEYSTDKIGEDYKKLSYAIYDINNDGINELILDFNNDTEYSYESLYTFSNNKIVLIDTIYVWNGFGIKYNKNTNEFIYMDMKTTGLGDGTRGSAIGYYKLINNKLELSRTIRYVMDLSTDKSTYYETKSNEKEVEITKDEYEKYSNEEISIEFEEVKQ